MLYSFQIYKCFSMEVRSFLIITCGSDDKLIHNKSESVEFAKLMWLERIVVLTNASFQRKINTFKLF